MISVFTPTYNRASMLKYCYESLKKQTNKNFNWIIIDDGSTDHTEKVVENFIKEKIIKINYFRQNNFGKQRATNYAIKMCETEFFSFLDSDDAYTENTINRFYELIPTLRNNNNVAGILGRRSKSSDINDVIGIKNVPTGIQNFDYVYKKFGYVGDTCRLYKTEIIKKFLYPEINDKFIPECFMLSQIDRKYDLLFVNEVFTICEYREDGLTKNSTKLYKSNPHGYSIGLNQLVKSKRGFLRNIKYMITYIVFTKKMNINKAFLTSSRKFLFLLVYPVSLLLYLVNYPRWIFDEK